MPLAIVFSRASLGIQAPLVTVETHISRGLPRFNIVGLAETAVKESKHRVHSALLNSQFKFPRGRITVNLAPADLPKEGGRFDLPIALGILAASEQISKKKLCEYEFTGELALSGELRGIKGVLPVVIEAKKLDHVLVIPDWNSDEACLGHYDKVLTATHLLEVCAHLNEKQDLTKCVLINTKLPLISQPDLAEVYGQHVPKQALEIAAAGNHSLLFIGPPGTGKTMIASRLPSILPPLSAEEALEVASVASISGAGFNVENWQRRPFRAPHHTASSVALVGGGRPPKPGEISLAHHGVLFLDELPEYNRQVIESLREPLESGTVTISRAAHQTIFPARFQLLAAMNPCPCGFYGNPKEECHCTSEQVRRYLMKISGPLLDRIDMQVNVPLQSSELLTTQSNHSAEKSAVILQRVMQARQTQLQRQNKLNAELTVKELQRHCELQKDPQKLLIKVVDKFNLSARVYHRILKVARTIADLNGEVTVAEEAISQALLYRCLDRTKLGY